MCSVSAERTKRIQRRTRQQEDHHVVYVVQWVHPELQRFYEGLRVNRESLFDVAISHQQRAVFLASLKFASP